MASLEKFAPHLAWLSAIAFAALAVAMSHAVSRQGHVLAFMPAGHVLQWAVSLTSLAALIALLPRTKGKGALTVVLGIALTAFAHVIGGMAVSASQRAFGPGGLGMAFWFVGMLYVIWLVATAFISVFLSELVILRTGQKSWLTVLAVVTLPFSAAMFGWVGVCIAPALLAVWWALAGLLLGRQPALANEAPANPS
ncbi:MAG: hypothetical protein ACREH4_06485 [Vitreimonas sp.]